MPPSAPSSTRRYDLDWIRVGAFGLLILYHVGLVYGVYGWHVHSVHTFEWMREAYAVDPAKADFEKALGRSVLDEMALYQAEQEASIAAASRLRSQGRRSSFERAWRRRNSSRIA